MNTYAENCLNLYQLMNKENYLEELTVTLSKICNNPVLTMDYRHKVHSHYGKGTKNSLTWNEMIENGSLNPNRIKDFFHNVIQTLIRNAKPLQIYYEDETIILTPVISNKTFMGLIAVLEIHHQLTPEEIEYTKIMADILSLHCEKSFIHDNENEYKHHHIIFDLLQNNILTAQELLKRMHERNWKPANFYRVLLADLSEYHRSYQEFIRDYCAYYSTHSKVMIYDNNLLIIECSSKPILKKAIESWLENFYLRVAVSDSFSELFQLPLYYKQASHTLLFSKNEKNPYNTYHYTTYRLDDFFKHCNDSFDTSTYFCPELIKLQEYDKTNQTELFHTLYTYLLHNKSVKETANQLSVHTNTINYRIKKIKELFPYLLENSKSTFHTLLTYFLIKNR